MNRFNRAFAAVPVVLLRILGGMSIAYAASVKLLVTPYAQEKRMRRVTMMTLAFLLLGTPATEAQPSDDDIPNDVMNAFMVDMLDDMHRGSDTAVVLGKDASQLGRPDDYTGVVGFGPIHEVYGWSQEYIAGENTDTPFRPYDEWIAASLLEDGTVVGTARVRRPTPTSAAEFGEISNRFELGQALNMVPDDAILVEDPTNIGWYAVRDGIVTAVSDQAAAEVPTPMTLDEFQSIIAERWAAREAASQGIPGSAGGSGVGDVSWWHRHEAAVFRRGGLVAFILAGVIAGISIRSVRRGKNVVAATNEQ